MTVEENLTLDERSALVRRLRATIAADLLPLSPRIRTLKSALTKLDPASTARLIHTGQPSVLVRPLFVYQGAVSLFKHLSRQLCAIAS